jgi:hypothetical protein
MKILYIDNTCNNGFVVLRYLRDMGYDVTLLLLDEPNINDPHGDPANDAYDLKSIVPIINTRWRERGLLYISAKAIKDCLRNYDFIIGGDWAPYLCYKANRQLDIFVPHGTDMFRYPFPMESIFSKIGLGNAILGYGQKKGIKKNVNVLMMERTNDQNESYLNRLKVNARFEHLAHFIPLVYRPQYQELAAIEYRNRSVPAKILKNIKDRGGKIVFHHCSHQWKNPSHDLFNKRSDQVIRGFDQYIKSNPDCELYLVMVERGVDVDESKKLITTLEIEHRVVWLNIMPRRDIMACLSYADIGVGELGHSFLFYSVVTEFICSNIPLIHHCDQDYYKSEYSDLYPMHSAHDADGVYDGIKKYLDNYMEAKQLAAKGLDWWIANVETKIMNAFTTRIEQKIAQME